MESRESQNRSPVFPVHPALAGVVREIRMEATEIGRASGPYRVLPGLAVVIGFQYRGRLKVLRETGSQILSLGGVTGLQAGPRWFVPEEQTRSVLIRLWPNGAYRLLGIPMAELAGEHVPLGQIVPHVHQIEERVSNSSETEVPSIVQEWLLGQLDRQKNLVHDDLADAMNRILNSHGRRPVERIADEVGVGKRQLERLFALQIGVGPKEFASLARFNWILENWNNRRSWAELAINAGYSDQAHFIRSFKIRAGVTPEEYCAT